MSAPSPDAMRFAIDRDEVVGLACDLIAIESHSQAEGREAAIGRFLAGWFRERGVEAELVPAIGDRANVIARVSLGDGAGPTVLLNGHIDTVPAGAMRDAFTPRIEEGVLWGRGACDMKGAVAAMCCVLVEAHRRNSARQLPDTSLATAGAEGEAALRRSDADMSVAAHRRNSARQLPDASLETAGAEGEAALRRSDADMSSPLRGRLVFAGTVDEETGSLGVKRLVESGLQAGYAVVGEPTSLRAAIAHKGACFLRIALTGRGAHGSCPEKGVSAISYGARVLAALEDELRPRLAARTHPLLGASTVSVGRLCGGTEPNIVAERCEIDVDRRTLPGESGTVAEVRAVVAGVCDGVEGLAYEVYETERTAAVPHVALGTPPDSPLVRAAREACRAAGVEDDPVGVTYWTDGAHLAASGIQTLILGPGDIAHAHGPHDRVRVADIAKAAEIYAGIVAGLLRA